MKKLSVLLLCVAIASSTYAQKKSPIRFGVKGGANLSRGAIDSDYDFDGLKNKFGVGFHVGGLMEVSGPAGSKLKGQVEALYNMHNFKNEYNDILGNVSGKTTLHQISVPVMLKYFITPRFSINAGPSVNFNIAGKTKSEITNGAFTVKDEVNLKDDDMLQTIQVGALAGVTYYIHKGFFVDARYNYYFGSAFKDDDFAKMRVSAIQLGVGNKF